MYFAPVLNGFPLEMAISAGGQKARMMGPIKKFSDIVQLCGDNPPR